MRRGGEGDERGEGDMVSSSSTISSLKTTRKSRGGQPRRRREDGTNSRLVGRLQGQQKERGEEEGRRGQTKRDEMKESRLDREGRLTRCCALGFSSGVARDGLEVGELGKVRGELLEGSEK